MSVWWSPSDRDVSTLQVEYCQLCGAPVGAADRVLAVAQGLSGIWVCQDHQELATSLSWLDLGGTGNASIPDQTPLPHSGRDIYEDAGVDVEGWPD